MFWLSPWRETSQIPQLKIYRNDSQYYIKNTAHDFSSHELSSNEKLALPYDLEQHIPLKLNKHTIKTEFEVRVCGTFQKAILV